MGITFWAKTVIFSFFFQLSVTRFCYKYQQEMKIFEILSLGIGAFVNAEEGCAAGEIDVGNGICTNDPTVALTLQNFINDNEETEPQRVTRRFPIGQATDSFKGPDENLRTKRRTQRLTLLMAKVSTTESGQNLRPRDFMRQINNYGCHCWTKPNTESIGYKGNPLDGIDRSCRTLKSCHTCINLQFENCDPVTTKYRAKVHKNSDGTIDIQCTNTINQKKNNNGECKRSLCECDKQFAEQVALSWHEWEDKKWKLDNKDLFDKACQATSSNVNGRLLNSGPPDQCCGSSYPDMKPFSTSSHTCQDSHILPKNNI